MFSIYLDLVKCHFEVASPGIKRVLGDPWARVCLLQAHGRWAGGGGGAEQHVLKRLY